MLQNIRGSDLHPKNRKYYYLEFLMKGISQAIRYEVTEHDQERLQRLLQKQEQAREPYFYFTSKDDWDVIVSIKDIQMVNHFWVGGLYGLRKKWCLPRIKLYFRGRNKPYEDFLIAADNLRMSYNLAYFGEFEPFYSFVNAEDDDIFFNLEEIIFLAFRKSRRTSQIVVRSIDGVSDFEPNEYGTLAAHIWQMAAPVGEEEDWEDDDWYGHIDFNEDDENTPYCYESDIYGPFATRTEAIAVVQKKFDKFAGQIVRIQKVPSI